MTHDFYSYRARAISGHSRLVAIPIRNHAKRQFLWVFYVMIGEPKKMIFEYKERPLMAWARYVIIICSLVVVSGKMSTFQEMNIGTPQGSRLSPLLFIILMADMDLWAGNSILSNFADDTQSIHISDKTESLLETTRLEANSIIKFF